MLLARRPAFAQHCARESNSERELAQVESPVDFPRKLSSESVNRARVGQFVEHFPEFFRLLYHNHVRRNFL